MKSLIDLISRLPWLAQMIVYVAAGALVASLARTLGWWLAPIAACLWLVVLVAYLYEIDRLPAFFRTTWLMDILDRLTNKAALQQMLDKKPVNQSREVDAEKLSVHLQSKVFGQPEVCRDVATQVRTRFAKTKRSKPVGVFMLAGPPATGKTWFAKVLAEALYGENSAMLVEMAQYGSAHAVSSLFGQAKGYVGADTYGLLTGALRDKPDRVIVLDEFEKADPDVHKRFLSAWNDGFITEVSTGEKVSTTDAIFVLTTNAAQRKIAELALQFPDNRDAYSDACKLALKDHFAPEVLSRIDRVFPFLPLKGLDQARIIAKQLESSIKEYDMEVDVIEAEVLFAAIQTAGQRNADPREIARIIEKMVDGQLVDLKAKGVRRVRLIEEDDAVVVRPA